MKSKEAGTKKEQKFFFLPKYDGEVAAVQRLPKELKATYIKAARDEVKTMGLGTLCKEVAL